MLIESSPPDPNGRRSATVIGPSAGGRHHQKNATGQLMPFMLSAHYLDLSQRQSFIPITQ